VCIVRQKRQFHKSTLVNADVKEYVIVDQEYLENNFNLAVSNDLKSNWESVFSFLPFQKTGGIFKVTYEKNAHNPKKVQVHAMKRNVSCS